MVALDQHQTALWTAARGGKSAALSIIKNVKIPVNQVVSLSTNRNVKPSTRQFMKKSAVPVKVPHSATVIQHVFIF